MKQSALIAVLAIITMSISACGGRTTEGQPDEGNGSVSSTYSGTVDYDTYFTPERLRIDLILAGGQGRQDIYLSALSREEAAWAGSPNSLIDPFGYGDYYYEAFAGDSLIFSKGISALFQEWLTTAAAKSTSMSMTQTIWMPFPKQQTKVVIYKREYENNRLYPVLSFNVDPQDKLISREAKNCYPVETILDSGDPSHKVDLLFVAEGYTAAEMSKFRSDAQRFTDYMFSFDPYKGRENDFNIRLVCSPSDDSGVDIPQDDIWCSTVCESNFYTFYIDRYLTISNHSKIADAVSGAPFDAIFVIANNGKYGGGGIFNSYAMGTSDNERAEHVFLHELGHSFAGLGDEYFEKEVAYEDFYNLRTEPWEPNLTTLVNFEAKWKDMLPADAVIPTMPNDSTMDGTLGVFEGGGYMYKGVYRPCWECRMHHNQMDEFCPVCQRAISRMIDYYVR